MGKGWQQNAHFKISSVPIIISSQHPLQQWRLGVFPGSLANVKVKFAVELETKVHTMVHNHGEGSFRRFQAGEGSSP